MLYDLTPRCLGCRAPIAYPAFRHCVRCSAAIMAAERAWEDLQQDERQDEQPTEPLPVVVAWTPEERHRLEQLRTRVAEGLVDEGRA